MPVIYLITVRTNLTLTFSIFQSHLYTELHKLGRRVFVFDKHDPSLIPMYSRVTRVCILFTAALSAYISTIILWSCEKTLWWYGPVQILTPAAEQLYARPINTSLTLSAVIRDAFVLVWLHRPPLIQYHYNGYVSRPPFRSPHQGPRHRRN